MSSTTNTGSGEETNNNKALTTLSSPTAAAAAGRAVILPGPELRDKINVFASELSTRDNKKAERLIAKLLASQQRKKYGYVDPSHVFYPYFLQQLTEYRRNPAARVKRKKEGGAAAGEEGESSSPATAADGQPKGAGVEGNNKTSTSSTTTTITTTMNSRGLVEVRGGTVGGGEEASEHAKRLQRLEEEARRYQDDPFPPRYSLDLQDGTLEVAPVALELISLTAQYAAKYGADFLQAVQAKQDRTRSVALQFLNEGDPRHQLFMGLIASYTRILEADDGETEERLVDKFGSAAFVRDLVQEKIRYVKAALARRTAELLTDETLKQRLQWNYFQVLHTFRLSDLLLDGAIPDTAFSLQRAAGGAPRYDSSAMVKRGREEEGGGVEEVDGEEEDPTGAPQPSSRPRLEEQQGAAEGGGSGQSIGEQYRAAAAAQGSPVYMSSFLVKPSAS